MKKYLLICLILITFGACNNKEEPTPTTSDSLTSIKRTPPPFQIVAERQTMSRALVAEPVLETVTDYRQRLVNGKVVYDTVVRTRTEKTETISYKYPLWNEVVKPFKIGTVPPVDPPPPTSASKYFSLPTKRTTEYLAKSNEIIENIDFTNVPGNAIRIADVTNVEVRNCYFNRSGEEAIEIERASNVRIHDNVFRYATSGVYALSSQTIKVYNNEFVNVRQRSEGGRGQFVQFNGVTGAGNLVEDNRGMNFLGESDPEDLVSMFRSSGTSTSPISIKRNIFIGGGPSSSGGGIMTGDYGGSYQIAEDNIVIDPGQYGMASAGGSNISILNNKIIAKQQPFTNNPLYVWAQQGASCNNITVKGNKVFWIDKAGSFNGGWNAGNCSSTSFEYPARWNSYNEAILSTGVTVSHIFKFFSAAELLTIRK